MTIQNWKSLQCPECGQPFGRALRLREHMMLAHGVPAPQIAAVDSAERLQPEDPTWILVTIRHAKSNDLVAQWDMRTPPVKGDMIQGPEKTLFVLDRMWTSSQTCIIWVGVSE